MNDSLRNSTRNHQLTTNTYGNETGGQAPLEIWTVLGIFSLLAFVTGVLSNGTLLVLFAKNRTLRTPFNIYLMNLLIANLACAATSYPMDLIYNLKSSVWLLGENACTAYLYSVSVLQAAIFHSHMLIAINRMWAVTHPISYRHIHSVRTAIIFCLGMWVYIHLVVAPEWAIDALYYRLPVEANGCTVNTPAQKLYDQVSQIAFYHCPHLVMLLAVPVMFYFERCRKLRRANHVTPNGHSVTQQQSARERRREHSAHGYFLLVLLTISTTVCWTPIDMYFMLKSFEVHMDLPIFYQVSIALFSCQTTMDPILFTLTMKNVRHTLKGIVACTSTS